MRHHELRRDERGVSLVLIVMLLVGMLTVAAIVLDWAVVRADRQHNKSAADFAVAAGAQGLQSINDGLPRPWPGVCEAYRFLIANDKELGDMTGAWKLGDGTALPTTLPSGITIPANPCNSTLPHYLLPCQAGLGGAAVPASWAWFDGTAGGGRIEVDIKSGYLMPDPDFETTTSDAGHPDQGGCDQIAVVVRERETAGFGKIIGADQLSSRVRSVARVTITPRRTAAVALLLLEQTDCLALDIRGGGTPGNGLVQVLGSGSQPGIIHADSDGSTNCGVGDEVVEGKSKNNVPLVRAEPAPSCSPSLACSDPALMGHITTYARLVGRSNDADWVNDRTRSHVWQCGTTNVCPSPPSRPTGSRRQTRSPADSKFLVHVHALRATANSAVFNAIDANVTPAGYSPFTTCDVNTAVNLTGSAKVFVDCEKLTIRNGGALTIDAAEVAFKGSIDINPGGTLAIPSAASIYVDGGNGFDAQGVDVSGSLTVNDGHPDACQTAVPNALRSILFIRRGPLEVVGGGAAKLCRTFVYLQGDWVTGSGRSRTWNPGTVPGLPGGGAPYPNDQTGFVSIAAGATIRWTAPDSKNVTPIETDYANWEDLALWTETADDTDIGGSGAMNLRGIYFLPNARVNLSGNGSGDIEADAQFFVRKLLNNGTVNFTMTTSPQNSLPTPFFEETFLVR